jgi:hypothetical protein
MPHAVCVVKKESEKEALALSPFTMRVCEMYRAAGIFSEVFQFKNDKLRALMVVPFDTSRKYEDMSVLKIEDPMIAVRDAASIPKDNSNDDEFVMIGAPDSFITYLGKAPETALVSNESLLEYLKTMSE